MDIYRKYCTGLFLFLILQQPLFSGLLSNADFENWSGNTPVDWSVTGSSYIAHETGIRHGGFSSVQISVPTSSSTAEISQDVPVQAGHVYTFSAWIYDNTQQGEIGLLINWRNEDGHIGSITSTRSSTGSGWEKIAIYDREVPANASFARLRIRAYKEDEGGGSIYVDDAQFLGDASLPVTVSSFQAEYDNGCVNLSWSTESEENVRGFTILKSSSFSGSFTNITSISACYGYVENLGGDYHYQDFNICQGQNIWYLLEEQFMDNTSNQYGPVHVVCNIHSDDIGSLCGVYPNPFNPVTKIRYRTGSSNEPTMLLIFNIYGELIRQWQTDTDSTGEFVQVWDGRDQFGETVAGGVYLVALRTGSIYGSVQKILKLH